MSRRIGLMGGTFDPVHVGHLENAKRVKESLQLDEMRLLPLAEPVHKDGPKASTQQRLECLRRAVEAFPHLSIDTTEIDRKGRSYTVDTMRQMRESNDDAIFYWVMGADAFAAFEQWKMPEEILNLANLVVINRPGSALELTGHTFESRICSSPELLEKPWGGISILEVPPIAVSSTVLREKLAKNQFDEVVVQHIPEAVLNYIKENNFYANKRDTMNVDELKDNIIEALEDIKAIDITVLAVGEMTSVADYLIVASGRSDRQVKSLAGNVQMKLKERDVRPLGVEGEREGQWVLLDYADILVHIMQPEMRDFYNLEKLWEQRPSDSDSQVSAS